MASDSLPNVHHMDTRSKDVQRNEAALSLCNEMTSTEKEAKHLYFDRFKKKEFLLNQAQDMPSFVFENALRLEELNIEKTVKDVHVSKISSDG